MGLDQSILALKNGRWKDNSKIIELAYFRKCWDLHPKLMDFEVDKIFEGRAKAMSLKDLKRFKKFLLEELKPKFEADPDSFVGDPVKEGLKAVEKAREAIKEGYEIYYCASM